jgi:hypothetical protein
VPVRLIFRCRTCGSEPDQLTQISIRRQLLHFRFGQYVDAGPGGWLIWHGRGPYGPTLYACGDHRAQLRAYVIKHYYGPHARSKETHPSLSPDDPEVARRRARYQGWNHPPGLIKRPQLGKPED